MSSTISRSQLIGHRLRAANKTRSFVGLMIVSLFLAVLALIMTAWSNEIFAYALGSELGSAVDPSTLPEPTQGTVWQQWTNNLVQMLSLIVAIMVANTAHQDAHSAAGHLLLTRPLRRRSVLLSNVVATMLQATVAAAIAAVPLVIGVLIMFDDVSVVPMIYGMLAWLVCTLVLAAGSAITGLWLQSRVGAIGVSAGFYFAFLILGSIPQLAKYTPFGLFTLPARLVVHDTTAVPVADIAWPIVTGLGISIVTIWIACRRFERMDL